MNWSLLWFLLAGAILGFALSTLWEWLYFRSKRAVIRDERIDELEAALRASREREVTPVAVASYADGAARLETEEPENLANVAEEAPEAEEIILEEAELEEVEAEGAEIKESIEEQAIADEVAAESAATEDQAAENEVQSGEAQADEDITTHETDADDVD